MAEPTTLSIAGYTDIGRRDKNEDALLIDRQLGLVVVADGVGGHHSGEVASAVTCDTLRREVAAGADLVAAVAAANRSVLAAVASGRGQAGMASTVVGALLSGDDFCLAWLGDSRAYLFDGGLRLLTRDHSYVGMQLARGEITPEEARLHPRRHIILQAVGLHGDGEFDVGTNAGTLPPGASLLLCSDGVSDALDNDRLSQLLGSGSAVEDLCRAVVNAALHSGGKDNATALLVRNDRSAPARALARADEVVWLYDPDSGEYVGEPAAPRRPAAAGIPVAAGPDPAYRARGPGGRADPERSSRAGPGAARGRRWHWWLILIAGALALGVAWSLH